MEIYTIGFTQKSARQFFGILKANDIRRVLDIRLSNGGSSLASPRALTSPISCARLCGRRLPA